MDEELIVLQKKLEKAHKGVVMTKEREDHLTDLRMEFEKEATELSREAQLRYMRLELEFLESCK